MRTEEYIPKRVKELCSKHKISKYRLAQLTDMSQTALGNIINKKSIPTVPTLERICDAFGISIAQFFAGEGMRPDLTDEQEELLEIWDDLNADERRILMNFVRTLKKKGEAVQLYLKWLLSLFLCILYGKESDEDVYECTG